MWPYFLILSLPALLAMHSPRRMGVGASIVVFVIYVIFVGFRDHVGPDWSGYENIHYGLAGEDIFDALARSDPASHLLFWVSENSGYHMLLSNVVAAVILMAGVFAFARRTLNPWLAIVAATPYLIIAFGMSGIRQAMGVGVFLFVLSRWQSIGAIGRAGGVLLAALFHTSSLVAGLFVIYDLKMKRIPKVVFGTLFGVAALFVIAKSAVLTEGMAAYQQRYFKPDSGQASSIGSIFHIGLIVIPAVIAVVYRKRIAPFIRNRSLLMLGVVFAFALLPLNVISTTVASRLTLLFYFVPMLVYPAMTYAFGGRRRSMMTVSIVVAHYLILGAWLLFANNSMTHIPYRNIIF